MWCSELITLWHFLFYIYRCCPQGKTKGYEEEVDEDIELRDAGLDDDDDDDDSSKVGVKPLLSYPAPPGLRLPTPLIFSEHIRAYFLLSN